MNNMLYVVYKDLNGITETGTLYTNYKDYLADTWNPDDANRVIFKMGFTIKGKTYQERKAAFIDIVKDFQNNIAGGLYWSDEIILQDFFETNGKRYGLLRELKENGII